MKRGHILVTLVAVLLVAFGIYVFGIIADGQKAALFSKVEANQPALTQAQVEELLGRPAHIEQSQSADQTLTGAVYHYPYHDRDMKVIFVNGLVFGTQFPSGAKS
jgi:hypothetical protein